MTLAERLKSLRTAHQMTQQDLSDALNRSGLKTTRVQIARWETGTQVPTLEPMIHVARILGTTVDYIASGDAQPHTISPLRQRIDDTLDNLNDEGQTKVADYADDLDKSGLYAKRGKTVIMREPEPAYDTSKNMYAVARVAAGEGAYNNDYQEPEQYRVRTADAMPCDSVARVVGNSMEPTYKDGDIVFVNENCYRDDGQIYIVANDDTEESVIKRCYFYKDHIVLRSDNPEWPDRTIKGKELNRTRIVGQVVGSATPIDSRG